jgi:hypothetical protein
MKKEDILKEIILELKNPSDFSLNFITSRNGIQCYFSQNLVVKRINTIGKKCAGF